MVDTLKNLILGTGGTGGCIGGYLAGSGKDVPNYNKIAKHFGY